MVTLATDDKPLRILEFGYPLFKWGVPEQTDYFWVDRRKRGSPLLQPRDAIRVLRRLRRGEYDLVSATAPEFPPFHPRSILTAIRDWHVQAPAALLAILFARFVHRFHDVPVAAIDIRDTFGIQASNLALLDRSAVYFKRELPADRWRAFFKTRHWDLPGARFRRQARWRRRIGKLSPLSLGLEQVPAFEPAEKTADIFFAGVVHPNSTVRAAGVAELLALRAEGFVVDMPQEKLDKDEFLRRLSSAWLAWSPSGFGWDCFRHYEAAAVGAVPLIDYPTVERHRPLLDGRHCVFHAIEPGGLAAAARRALADREALRRMAAEARTHVLAHHTCRARAEHIARTVLGRNLDGSAARADASIEAPDALPSAP
jgi:hypothetical protein